MPIPVTLITGYLGAGKTTLLNRLLSLPPWQQGKAALVINEFSNLGVDGALVESGDHAQFEINRGSVFCACTHAEFLDVLRRIVELPRCDSVLVEATGISETTDLEGCFHQAGLHGRFAIAANLCLVDAVNFFTVAGVLRAARSQVESADALIVNKADLVGPEELAKLHSVLASLNPLAPQIVTSYGNIGRGFLDGLAHRPGNRLPMAAPADPVVSVSVQTERPLDRARFECALAQLGAKLLRLKGNIDFGQGPRFVELAGDRLTEKAPREALPPGTAFSAIAWQIGRDELRSMLEPAPP